MKKITDKIPILFFCCILISQSESRVIPVAAFLISVCISAINQVTENRRIISALQSAYLILCFFEPDFFCFFPVMAYDIIGRKNYYMLIPSAFIFIRVILHTSAYELLAVTALTLTAFLLGYRTLQLEELSQKYIETRDSSAELNIALNAKNRQLLDNQDYEIHLATLQERNRIAREIHDNVGHLLSRSILQLGAMGFITDDNMRKEYIASLSETLNNAMNSVRKSVHDLHDDSIDLMQSMKEIINPLKDKNIEVKSKLECSENISNEYKFCIIGVTKEAVSNIIKHSSCDMANIQLIDHPAFIQLKIHDNGECSEVIQNNGIGLSNMRERVEKLGGIITFSSGKSGFDVFVSLKK